MGCYTNSNIEYGIKDALAAPVTPAESGHFLIHGRDFQEVPVIGWKHGKERSLAVTDGDEWRADKHYEHVVKHPDGTVEYLFPIYGTGSVAIEWNSFDEFKFDTIAERGDILALRDVALSLIHDEARLCFNTRDNVENITGKRCEKYSDAASALLGKITA